MTFATRAPSSTRPERNFLLLKSALQASKKTFNKDATSQCPQKAYQDSGPLVWAATPHCVSGPPCQNSCCVSGPCQKSRSGCCRGSFLVQSVTLVRGLLFRLLTFYHCICCREVSVEVRRLVSRPRHKISKVSSQVTGHQAFAGCPKLSTFIFFVSSQVTKTRGCAGE
jgi:hypothetical protein